ncbi:hypothetical protein N8072_01630 [bacterium]|nr:hypothetical protein [bacterium]MDB4128545.1 hypothetical protein [bacterium]MDC1257355.1 hypothetical protein [bacterium]
MEHFLTLYTSGLCGTWITWFASQHDNFHKFEKETITTDGTITDLAVHGATWCFAPDTEDNAIDEAMTFDEYQKRWMIPYSRNPKATKNCIKVLPDHDLGWDEHQSTEVRQKVLKPFTGVIIPYLPHDSPFVKMLALRNCFMWPDMPHGENETVEEFWTLALTNARRDMTVGKMNYVNSYAKTHYLNLHALLMCEEREYLDLCDFLGEEPLPKWEDHVNLYRTAFICKDWKTLIKKREESSENSEKS